MRRSAQCLLPAQVLLERLRVGQHLTRLLLAPALTPRGSVDLSGERGVVLAREGV